MCKTITHFSGILDKSLDTVDFFPILFIIRRKIRPSIFVEDEIHRSVRAQEEKGFDYLPVFHYARAIKMENVIFHISQIAETIILHLVVLLALDFHGDFLPGILRIEGMQHFEGFLHDLHGCRLQLVEAS